MNKKSSRRWDIRRLDSTSNFWTKGKPAALLLTGHHAQAPAVLDHSRTLPQGDGGARPALAGSEKRGECDLVVLDASDVFHDAFAVRCPSIDAEGEVSSRRGHLRPLLLHSSSASRFTAGAFAFFILSQSGER